MKNCGAEHTNELELSLIEESRDDTPGSNQKQAGWDKAVIDRMSDVR